MKRIWWLPLSRSTGFAFLLLLVGGPVSFCSLGGGCLLAGGVFFGSSAGGGGCWDSLDLSELPLLCFIGFIGIPSSLLAGCAAAFFLYLNIKAAFG